jgi:macrolide transport system ATP-binding/permease protein
MSLVIHQITKSYGLHQILNGVSLALNPGQRVGLVGANGVGKSTLLKIVVGEVEADSGSVQHAPGEEIGYLAQVIHGFEGQTIDQLAAAALGKLRQLEARLRDLEDRMAAASGSKLERIMAEYGEVTAQFEHYGGYELDYRLDQVFDGLGIGHIPRNRLFGSLSGGEKSRVGLALLLLGAYDVLLLDEPTNHLDFASMNWLEGYLRAYRGGLLIVSHDRQFLNRTVTAIVEIDEHQRTAKHYGGDYDAYLVAKAQERRKWREDYARQQEEINALRLQVKETARRNNNYRTHSDSDKYIRNFKKAQHDTTVSKRIHVAEEKLRRIETDPIPEPPDDLRFNPDFDPQALKGRLPLIAGRLTKTFGGRAVLADVSLELGVHSRVVIVGPNGAGKSTLLRILAGYEQADGGSVQVNPGVRLGYLDQEQETLYPNLTLFEMYRLGLPETDQQLKATLLKSGLFRYEEFGKRVGELSRGQQRKLQIARLIAARANLLILDEPTNSISFDVLEAFETALRGFPGPIIAASHDRRFIENFGGEVWEMRDGALLKNTTAYWVGAPVS